MSIAKPVMLACCFFVSGRAVAEAAACDPHTVETAAAGYSCVVKTKAGPVTWRVEAVVQDARTFRVVKDLKRGLYVSDDLGRHSNMISIRNHLCTDPAYAAQRGNLAAVAWRMPSGYPRALDGKKPFPGHDSDFVMLDDDGIRQVIAGLANRWFVTSSDPGGGYFYGYDGDDGGLDVGCDGNGNTSLRCVGD